MSNFEHGEQFAGGFLSHFGVKGMRWGRRKDTGNSAVGGSTKKKEEVSEDAAKAGHLSSKVRSSGTKSLSNQELRELVNRMRLEQDFAKINTPAARKQNPILAGVVWTTKKAATLTGQSVEQVIKANLANEMNQRVKAQLNSSSKSTS